MSNYPLARVRAEQTQAEIRKALEQGVRHTRDLIAICSASTHAVYVQLSALEKAGEVRKVKLGTHAQHGYCWHLTGYPPTPAELVKAARYTEPAALPEVPIDLFATQDDDDPALMSAWERYKQSMTLEPLVNYARRTGNVQGAMFAAFYAGYHAVNGEVSSSMTSHE